MPCSFYSRTCLECGWTLFVLVIASLINMFHFDITTDVTPNIKTLTWYTNYDVVCYVYVLVIIYRFII